MVFAEPMRPMHLAITGFTGTGKSYFLENLIRQDIDQETGFVVFDVHGDLADNLVQYLAERVRGNPDLQRRVVIIEPFCEEYAVGFNPLERTPHTSPFLQAQQLAYILRSRWETKSFGPRTEELLRSSIYTLAAHDLTLLELPHLLTYAPFRAELLRSLPDPAVSDYWTGRYNRLSEPMKAAVREPLLTRVSAFLSDPQVRETICQTKSTFTFRDAMANSLWVVVNLSKGHLGDENSSVLGSLFFTKLHLDIMGRAQLPSSKRTLFAVYADELQNLAGGNFATLVAEARKYGVSITAGHQFLHQLTPEMHAAMLGVGSRVLFRLHYRDARELAAELDASQRDYYAYLLTGLDRAEAIFRGGAQGPVRFRVLPHLKPHVDSSEVSLLKKQSFAGYALPREDVRTQITERTDSLALPQTTTLANRPLPYPQNGQIPSRHHETSE